MNGEKLPRNINRGETMSINDALAEIQIIKQNVMTSGRIDFEADQFTHLIIDVRNGRLKPEDGVTKARELEAVRQEDH